MSKRMRRYEEYWLGGGIRCDDFSKMLDRKSFLRFIDTSAIEESLESTYAFCDGNQAYMVYVYHLKSIPLDPLFDCIRLQIQDQKDIPGSLGEDLLDENCISQIFITHRTPSYEQMRAVGWCTLNKKLFEKFMRRVKKYKK
jgi:hypothetical protein